MSASDDEEEVRQELQANADGEGAFTPVPPATPGSLMGPSYPQTYPAYVRELEAEVQRLSGLIPAGGGRQWQGTVEVRAGP